MSKKSENVVRDSESSTSQSDDEQKLETKEWNRKPRDEKRETRGPGQKKRLPESEGATSSGIVLQPSHASKKDYTDQDVRSPSKRTRHDRPPLDRVDAFDKSKCDCGEDSNHAPTCSMSNLELKDESVGKEGNVASSETPGGCGSSAAGSEQFSKMDHLSVPIPGQRSEVHPTSPKEKGILSLVRETGKKVWDSLRVSPKHSSDKKKSSSGKADLKLKQKSPRGKLSNLNPTKSEASSSSSSPISKKDDSSPDRSLPSTSSSDPNVEYPKPPKKSPHKFKSKAESSSASTSDDSQQRATRLKVPSRGEDAGSPRRRSRSRSLSPLPPCNCNARLSNVGHETGCSRWAEVQRRKNARSCRLSTKPPGSTDDSSGTASDPNAESSPATKSPNKLRKTASPRISTGAEPGTSGLPHASSPGNSPNRSDEAVGSPNRSCPSRSRSTSQRYPGQTSRTECRCHVATQRGQHEEGCPFWSPSRQR